MHAVSQLRGWGGGAQHVLHVLWPSILHSNMFYDEMSDEIARSASALALMCGRFECPKVMPACPPCRAIRSLPCEPVRLLHAWHGGGLPRGAAQRGRRGGRRGRLRDLCADARRHRRQPVPLHRLPAHHRRCQGAQGGEAQRHACTARAQHASTPRRRMHAAATPCSPGTGARAPHACLTAGF